MPVWWTADAFCKYLISSILLAAAKFIGPADTKSSAMDIIWAKVLSVVSVINKGIGEGTIQLAIRPKEFQFL